MSLSTLCHIIATMRTKQDCVLNEKNGKYIPEEVGLKVVQRDNVDDEFTLVWDIDIKHHAVASKDKRGLFMRRPDFTIPTTPARRYSMSAILHLFNHLIFIKTLKVRKILLCYFKRLKKILTKSPDDRFAQGTV